MAERLRILTVLSSADDGILPADRNAFGLDHNAIEDQLLSSTNREYIELLSPVIEPTVFRLQNALATKNPQIVHFACHGSPTGLTFRSAQNKFATEELPTRDLLRLLRGSADIRLVVLNSCKTYELGRALRKTVPFVVAMNRDISDGAATAFASGFYGGLGAGKSLGERVRDGRRHDRVRKAE